MKKTGKAVWISAMLFMAGCAVDPTLDDGTGNDSVDQASNSTASGSGAGSGATDPSKTFNNQVKPITDLKCLPCHNGNVNGTPPPNLTSYATLDPRYITKPGASSLLLTKGIHEGPSLTAAEVTSIAKWIDSLSAPDPSTTYNTQVKPIFTQLCVACHNANLPPNFTSYATLAPIYRTKPGASSPLVTKGAHEGPSLTQAQATIIINWINSLP